jgi:hypothetical protein
MTCVRGEHGVSGQAVVTPLLKLNPDKELIQKALMAERYTPVAHAFELNRQRRRRRRLL